MPPTRKTIWVLCLNDMRSPNFEKLQPVIWSDDVGALKALLDRERVTPYLENYVNGYGESLTWGKSFRRGGPLEWCNPPGRDTRPNFVPVTDVIEVDGQFFVPLDFGGVPRLDGIAP